MKRDSAIDPILVSVIQKRLKSITEEMGLTLLRTTRSPIFNEARDFVTGLYDAQGRMLEQTEYIPILAFALQPVCQYIIKYFGSEIYPGDIIIHNDVFTGGNQNSDVAIFKPIFYEDELVAWAACKGHQADIGGAVVGGYNPEAREVWQEALRIPPVKIYEKGVLRRDVWNLIFANIRLPVVEEDIKAQIGSCNLGERRVTQLLQRYGVETFKRHVEYLMDSTERMMRKEIKNMPDGVYTAETYMNYDGITEGSRYKIRLTVTIRDDEIYFDYTGTDPQTPGFTNAPLYSTVSAVILVFLMHVNPNIPHNEGMLRPIHIYVPEGCFLNAKFPAATTFGNTIANCNADALFQALAQAVPDRVTAGWNRQLGNYVSGWDPKKQRRWGDILFLALKGGSGGTLGADGYDHIGQINCAGGIMSQDYERLEIKDPLFLIKHEYMPDSAGAGEYRGGLGVQTILRFDSDDNICVTYGDGVEEGSGAFGLFGGEPGGLNQLKLTYPDGRVVIAKSKQIISNVPRGTIFEQIAGGGGGYGDPKKRPKWKVLQEVKEGTLSPEKAKTSYGVTIDG